MPTQIVVKTVVIDGKVYANVEQIINLFTNDTLCFPDDCRIGIQHCIDRLQIMLDEERIT